VTAKDAKDAQGAKELRGFCLASFASLAVIHGLVIEEVETGTDQ
jgi:hypothetical protein